MKNKSIKNNVENKINIGAMVDAKIPTIKFKRDGVGVDSHIDPLKNKGITLIALIITIILMLILVGVVLNLTLGENGLIKIAGNAASKYKQEEIREKVQLEIANVIGKELVLGNEITVGNVLQELVENKTFETIDKETNTGTMGEYDVKLKRDEAGNIVIESIEKATGVRITYKLDPVSYTNSEQVSILFNVTGKVKSVTKPDGLVVYPQGDKLAIDYKVDNNGTYPFIVENTDGTNTTKEVIVDTIDRLKPLDFEVTAEFTEDGLKITAKAEDAETDGISIKSGIKKYEYYVKKTTDTKYPETPYTVDTITGLPNGIYNIYVVVYDKAGNDKSSKEIEVKRVGPQIGDFVNYSAGNWTQEDLEKLGVVFDAEGNIIDNGILYEGPDMPSSPLKFGGFAIGDSKDASIISWKTNKNNYSGWRVLTLNDDGSIKEIIHAGTPEAFNHTKISNSQSYAVYILCGVMNPKISGFDYYEERKWSMYEDGVFAVDNSTRVYQEEDYLTSENSVRLTGSFYWVPYVEYYDLRIRGDGGAGASVSKTCGVRPIVTLKSGVKAKPANTSDTTHDTPETAWNLEL